MTGEVTHAKRHVRALSFHGFVECTNLSPENSPSHPCIQVVVVLHIPNFCSASSESPRFVGLTNEHRKSFVGPRGIAAEGNSDSGLRSPQDDMLFLVPLSASQKNKKMARKCYKHCRDQDAPL